MPIKFYKPDLPRPPSRIGHRLQGHAHQVRAGEVAHRWQRRASGRNHHGVITAKHHGGGNKRLYRIIDFKRNTKDGIPANVKSIEYDPNRSCFIALIEYQPTARKVLHPLPPTG